MAAAMEEDTDAAEPVALQTGPGPPPPPTGLGPPGAPGSHRSRSPRSPCSRRSGHRRMCLQGPAHRHRGKFKTAVPGPSSLDKILEWPQHIVRSLDQLGEAVQTTLQRNLARGIEINTDFSGIGRPEIKKRERHI